jgi:hypothetical protein
MPNGEKSRGVSCQDAKRQRLPQRGQKTRRISESVEMPEKVGEFVRACAKVGVHIKLPPKINFTYKPGEFRKMNPD